MPEEGVPGVGHENVLSYEEMFEFVKVCIDGGVKKVRLTGGEPLVRKDVDKFIRMISDYAPNLDLAMTTNGFLLPQVGAKLKDAGLKRLNISLDTLDPQKAAFIARRDILEGVLKGIKTASELGFALKLNTVALRKINEGELVSLLEFARDIGAQIRYIEYMENSHATSALEGLRRDEILEIIGRKYPFREITKSPNSPSELYELSDGYKFGIIDPHKHDFCATCNRLRLSSEGMLIPCLYFEEGRSILKAMREHDIDAACEILAQVLREKPEKNKWADAEGVKISNRGFFQTGG
jgi:cyclic pyranopterin phosphate synthase